MKYATWTTHEIERVRECYPSMSIAEVQQAIPRHSLSSIEKMAAMLRIRRRKDWRDWMRICAAHQPVIFSGGRT